MATIEEDGENPYELLGLTIEATEQEIKTAYRQRSLKVHPDRNRGNPDAARKFHELNQAYELLLDPLRRMALDAKLRIKEARKARFAKFDNKRKNMVSELEERERAVKKAKVEKEEKEKEVRRENEKVMEEGRLMREKKEREIVKREREAAEKAKREEERHGAGFDPPSLGDLDTTVRLKYPLTSHPALTTPDAVSDFLSSFGAVDTSEIVIALKPPPPKKPKRGTALVSFKQVGDAFAAVCASGEEERGLKDVEVTWAEGDEPELIVWLKRMGKLSNGWQKKESYGTPSASSKSPPVVASVIIESTPDIPFSSFPSTFPDLSDSTSTTPTSSVAGLDYEALTLMRLRQAERERLEREIREQEAQEERS